MHTGNVYLSNAETVLLASISMQVGQVDMIGGGAETGEGGVVTEVGGVEAGVDEVEAQDEAASGSVNLPGNNRAMVATTSTTELLDDFLMQTCTPCN